MDVCPICEKRFPGFWMFHQCSAKALRAIDAKHRMATDDPFDDDLDGQEPTEDERLAIGFTMQDEDGED